MRRLRISQTMRTTFGASGLTTLGTLPVFLLSAQAVYIRADLAIDPLGFGIAVSIFFTSAAVVALLGGGVVDRMGRRRSTLVAGGLATLGGLGTAFVVHSFPALLAMMAVLGVTNAACQMTSNVTLARAVPASRRGLGFGIKQAAIPLSIVLAGLAVPFVGASAGWRWTFVMTGVAGLVVVATGWRIAGDPKAGSEQGRGLDRPSMVGLLLVTAAIMLASASANSLGSFIGLWSVEVGLTPSQAGVMMATGSALNIAVRVVSGYLADLRHGRNLPWVAAQMAVGGAALAALSVATPWAVVSAALVAFGVGWSWPGLLLYAVVRVGRDSPAFASGMVQGGAFIGGAAGPALFGLVVASQGYDAAWRIAAVLFLAAALLVGLARRVIIADLVARPPLTPFGYGGGRDAPSRTTGPPR